MAKQSINKRQEKEETKWNHFPRVKSLTRSPNAAAYPIFRRGQKEYFWGWIRKTLTLSTDIDIINWNNRMELGVKNMETAAPFLKGLCWSSCKHHISIHRLLIRPDGKSVNESKGAHSNRPPAYAIIQIETLGNEKEATPWTHGTSNRINAWWCQSDHIRPSSASSPAPAQAPHPELGHLLTPVSHLSNFSILLFTGWQDWNRHIVWHATHPLWGN